MIRLACLLASLLAISPAIALAEPFGFQPPPGIKLQDEGADQAGRATRLNCTGAGIACSMSGSTGTLNVTGGGGGGATWTTVEIDFSLTPAGAAGGSRFVQTKTIADAGVSTSSKIIAVQAGTAATGRQADENEMDEITCRGIPASGTFTLICSCARSVTHGLFKVQYSVGS